TTRELYLVGQTGSIGDTNIFASIPAKGMWTVVTHAPVTATGTTGTFASQVKATGDSGASQTQTLITGLALNGANESGAVGQIETDGSTHANYNAHLTRP